MNFALFIGSVPAQPESPALTMVLPSTYAFEPSESVAPLPVCSTGGFKPLCVCSCPYKHGEANSVCTGETAGQTNGKWPRGCLATSTAEGCAYPRMLARRSSEVLKSGISVSLSDRYPPHPYSGVLPGRCNSTVGPGTAEKYRPAEKSGSPNAKSTENSPSVVGLTEDEINPAYKRLTDDKTERDDKGHTDDETNSDVRHTDDEHSLDDNRHTDDETNSDDLRHTDDENSPDDNRHTDDENSPDDNRHIGDENCPDYMRHPDDENSPDDNRHTDDENSPDDKRHTDEETKFHDNRPTEIYTSTNDDRHTDDEIKAHENRHTEIHISTNDNRRTGDEINTDYDRHTYRKIRVGDASVRKPDEGRKEYRLGADKNTHTGFETSISDNWRAAQGISISDNSCEGNETSASDHLCEDNETSTSENPRQDNETSTSDKPRQDNETSTSENPGQDNETSVSDMPRKDDETDQRSEKGLNMSDDRGTGDDELSVGNVMTSGQVCSAELKPSVCPHVLLPPTLTPSPVAGPGTTARGCKRKYDDCCRVPQRCAGVRDVAPRQLSPLTNTPRERKEERRKLFRISYDKFKLIDNPEHVLRRSVLIRNVIRKIQADIRG